MLPARHDDDDDDEISTHRGEHIYCHPQTILFYPNSSVWLDMQDASSSD